MADRHVDHSDDRYRCAKGYLISVSVNHVMRGERLGLNFALLLEQKQNAD